MSKRASLLPDVDDKVMDHAFNKAEAVLKSTSRLAHTKYKGLANLDEFNEIMLIFGTALFQLGVKRGARRK